MLLADTNIWLAAADRRSDRHRECAAILREHGGELAAPVPVIAETSWLILDRLGTAAQASFLRLAVRSLRLDLIDASLVAVAERLGHTTLATLNHRDFTVVRPRHVAAFTLLPG